MMRVLAGERVLDLATGDLHSCHRPEWHMEPTVLGLQFVPERGAMAVVLEHQQGTGKLRIVAQSVPARQPLWHHPVRPGLHAVVRDAMPYYYLKSGSQGLVASLFLGIRLGIYPGGSGRSPTPRWGQEELRTMGSWR
jgi:hypothetical protein